MQSQQNEAVRIREGGAPLVGLVDLPEGGEVPLLQGVCSRSGLWCLACSFPGTLGACGAATLAQEGGAKLGVTVLAWYGEEGKNCPLPQGHTTPSWILPEVTLKIPSGTSVPQPLAADSSAGHELSWARRWGLEGWACTTPSPLPPPGECSLEGST